MGSSEKDNLVFSITLEDLQSEALEKIGRTLTAEEIQVARKGLEFGLCTDVDNIYSTVFTGRITKLDGKRLEIEECKG